MIHPSIRQSLLYKFVSRLFFIYRLTIEYIYDSKKYIKYNSESHLNDLSQLEGKIIALYHVLEKGMSHHDPKKLFSEDKALKLAKLLLAYKKIADYESIQVQVSATVLQHYLKHDLVQFYLSDEKKKFILKAVEDFKIIEDYKPISVVKRELYFKESESSFRAFAESRRSVRNFSDIDVKLLEIEDAISIARHTPSVCNRQTCRVHVISNKELIKKHLEYHNGSRGFASKINKLLIVTSDIKYFEGVRERNQAFVDGGMFSMSLLYALHHLRIAAVPLNWCYDKEHDEGIRSLGTIPDEERIIMLIGVGYAPDIVHLPASIRRDVIEIVKHDT